MYAFGAFTPFPSPNNTCTTMGTLAPAEARFEEVAFPITDAGEENFSLASLGLGGTGYVDGGSVVFPERYMKYEWSNFTVIATADVPGQLFTADLRITDDTCVADYGVKAIWPMTLCRTDLDCHPYPLPDAGDYQTDLEDGGVVLDDAGIAIVGRRFQGSGLNPSLETPANRFRCNLDPKIVSYMALAYGVGDWGVCESTRALTDFTNPTR
jgi:hypothetical protein